MKGKNISDDLMKPGQNKSRLRTIMALLNDNKVVILCLLVVAALFSYLFISHYGRSYTASVLIYPDQTKIMDFGIRDSQFLGDTDYSLYGLPFETYPALLRSPEIQMQVLQKSYAVTFNYKSYSIDLVKYFAFKNISYALQELDNITDISFLDNSRVLKLSVTTRYADLSRKVADEYLAQLQDRLETLRKEKLSEKIDQLDKSLQFMRTDKSISDSARDDIIGKLQSRKEAYLRVAALAPPKLGMVREGYVKKNMPLSMTGAVLGIIAVGIWSVLVVLVMSAKRPESRSDEFPASNRLMLKRPAETESLENEQRFIRRKTRKTSSEKKPQRRRGVKV